MVPAIVPATTVTVGTLVWACSAVAVVTGGASGYLGYAIGRSKNPHKKILQIEQAAQKVVDDLQNLKSKGLTLGKIDNEVDQVVEVAATRTTRRHKRQPVKQTKQAVVASN